MLKTDEEVGAGSDDDNSTPEEAQRKRDEIALRSNLQRTQSMFWHAHLDVAALVAHRNKDKSNLSGRFGQGKDKVRNDYNPDVDSFDRMNCVRLESVVPELQKRKAWELDWEV